MSLQRRRKELWEDKKEILEEIENIRTKIQNLGEEEFDLLYDNLSNQLNEMKQKLETNRELGGDFEISEENTKKILEVTEDGQLIFSTVTIEKKNKIPIDTSNISFFRIELKEESRLGEEEDLYYFYESHQILYLENIQTIRRINENTLQILWSNAAVQKSNIESCNNQESEELECIIGTKLKKFNRTKIQQINILKGHWKEMATEYNSSNESHESLLMELWNTSFPGRTLEARISKDWNDLGFQGKNPATDFRGGGVLSLKNLIYMAKNYHNELSKIVGKQSDYPFASAGINVTLIIMNDFLKLSAASVNYSSSHPTWDSPLLYLFTYSNSPNALEEFFCMFMIMLDVIWTKMNATYMDFPNVMKQTVSQMNYLLSRRPLRMEQFHALLKQAVLLLDEEGTNLNR